MSTPYVVDPTKHIGLAWHLARRFHRRRTHSYQQLLLEDFVQEALYGICKAAQSYDPERGVPFANYAAEVAKGYMLQAYFRNRRVVHFGSAKRSYRIRQVLGDISHKVAPDTAKLAKELGYSKMSEEEAHRAIGYQYGKDLSIDALFFFTQEYSARTDLSELLAEPSAYEGVEKAGARVFRVAERLYEKLVLPPETRKRYDQLLRERILAEVVGEEPKSLEEIGQDWGCTRQRVQQIEARLLRALRDVATSEGIDAP